MNRETTACLEAKAKDKSHPTSSLVHPSALPSSALELRWDVSLTKSLTAGARRLRSSDTTETRGNGLDESLIRRSAITPAIARRVTQTSPEPPPVPLPAPLSKASIIPFMSLLLNSWIRISRRKARWLTSGACILRNRNTLVAQKPTHGGFVVTTIDENHGHDPGTCILITMHSSVRSRVALLALEVFSFVHHEVQVVGGAPAVRVAGAGKFSPANPLRGLRRCLPTPCQALPNLLGA